MRRFLSVALLVALPRAVLGTMPSPAVSILVGGATVAPGQRAAFDVVIEHQSAPIATQNGLSLPPLAHLRSCTLNLAINKNSSRLVLMPQGCTPGIDCGSVQALIFAFDENPSVIPSGSVLYSCTVDVDASTPSGTVLPITCSDPGASTADARMLDTVCRDGAITVTDPVVSLDLGRTTVAPGGRAAIPMYANLLHDDVDIVGVRTRLRVGTDAPIAATDDGTPDCWSDLSDLAQAQFDFTPAGCNPGDDCIGVDALVVRTATHTIPDGALVLHCAIQVPDATPPGSYLIRHVPGAQSAVDAAGVPRAALATDGEIVVRAACIGDCDGDGVVPVGELVTGVNILLGRVPFSTCRAFDRNLNGVVTVDELVTGIGDALRGCGN